MQEDSVMIPSEIKSRYEDLCVRIEDAAGKSGKKLSDIVVIAVTKKVEIPKIQEAIKLGISHFGENYVQEAKDKIVSLGREVNWHFIGHLQKNKVNLAVDLFDMIQSVDSVALAERLDRRCQTLDKKVEILLQIYYGQEETKHGFAPIEVRNALERISQLKYVRVVGLMTIPPYVPDPEFNRRYFRDMYNLSLCLDSMGYANWENKYRSMGMTDDFEIAIQEGSNMVRIGRAIFGERK